MDLPLILVVEKLLSCTLLANYLRLSKKKEKKMKEKDIVVLSVLRSSGIAI